MLPPLPPSLIARVRKLSAREEGFEGVRGRKGEKKSESHGGASAGRPVRPRVDAALRRRTATRRETEKPLWNAGRLLNAMRELSRPDILSAMPGTGNRKVEFTLVPDLIGRFALCRAPTRFPQCHGRRGGRGKKEKRKELQDSENAGEDFIWLASRKRGEEERRWEGKRVFDLYLFYIGGEIIERGREKSLEIEAKCYFFFFFCSSSITRGYRGGSKNLSKKKWTFVGQRRWLISRIGAIIRHMRVFLSFAYLPDATNRETMQSRETHDHTRNAKLG